MSASFNKKAFNSPYSYSPASTLATEADAMSQQSSLSAESETPDLASPLLGSQARLSDELPHRSGSRFGFATSLRLRIGLALIVAFALGLFAGRLDGFKFHTMSAHFRHTGPRGGSWWQKRGIEPGTRMELIVHNRSVLVYMPWSALTVPTPKLVPAVFVLHGSEDTPSDIADAARFEGVAEAHNSGFLLVYPEMQHYMADAWGYDDPREMTFFRDLPDAIAHAGFPIDQAKVFVCGHSAGGTMSLFLQNNMPDVFRGAAAVEAGVGHLWLWQNKSFGRPTMVVWNHNDNVLAKYGGESLYQQTLLQLRRHDPSSRFGSGVGAQDWRPITGADRGVVYANRLYWPARGNAPPLVVVSWRSVSPTHNWANPVNVPGSFDAAAQIWSFFLELHMDVTG